MDSDGLPIVGAGVDYSKVGPIHQKRTLTFLNHFLIRTTSFLNHFATVCDEKLENLLLRIQRLEASMSILEAKLISIPGLDDITLDKSESQISESQPPQTLESTSAESPSDAQHNEDSAAKKAEPEKVVNKVSQDPRFSKYFKMVNMGVPVAAVKLKMNAEGVNPDILDDPDAEAPPLPEGRQANVNDESEDSNVSDFSD